MPELQGIRQGAQSRQAKEKMIEYTNSEISAIIDEVIHSERNRLLLKRRLIDGICYEPLSEEFNLSVRQTKSIIYREQEKIFKKLS